MYIYRYIYIYYFRIHEINQRSWATPLKPASFGDFSAVELMTWVPSFHIQSPTKKDWYLPRHSCDVKCIIEWRHLKSPRHFTSQKLNGLDEVPLKSNESSCLSMELHQGHSIFLIKRWPRTSPNGFTEDIVKQKIQVRAQKHWEILRGGFLGELDNGHFWRTSNYQLKMWYLSLKMEWNPWISEFIMVYHDFEQLFAIWRAGTNRYLINLDRPCY